MRLGADLPEVASETLATRTRTPALTLDLRDVEPPALPAGIVVTSCAAESAESDDENRRPDFSFPCAAKAVVLSLTAVFLLSAGRRQLVERGMVDFLLAPVAAAAGLNLAMVVT